jgi:hypothetical protein
VGAGTGNASAWGERALMFQPQGGANERQPLCPDCIRESAAASSRRSPYGALVFGGSVFIKMPPRLG